MTKINAPLSDRKLISGFVIGGQYPPEIMKAKDKDNAERTENTDVSDDNVADVDANVGTDVRTENGAGVVAEVDAGVGSDIDNDRDNAEIKENTVVGDDNGAEIDDNVATVVLTVDCTDVGAGVGAGVGSDVNSGDKDNTGRKETGNESVISVARNTKTVKLRGYSDTSTETI